MTDTLQLFDPGFYSPSLLDQDIPVLRVIGIVFPPQNNKFDRLGHATPVSRIDVSFYGARMVCSNGLEPLGSVTIS